MGIDLTNLVAIGVGAAAFLTTITAVFLFVTAPNEKLARTLGFAMTASAAWAWFGFAYYLTSDAGIAREFGLLSTLAQTLTNMFVIQYGYVYLAEGRQPATRTEQVLYWALMMCGMFLILLTVSDLFGTQFIASSVEGYGTTRLATNTAPFKSLHVAYYCLLIFVIPWVMSRRFMRETGSMRRVGIILAAGMILTYLLGATGFATWYGITGPFTILQGFALPAFITVAFYTISNYRLFNLRVAAAELFVFGLWGFMFLRVLIHPTIASALPDVAILAATVITGLLLIKNVTKELAVRIQLEKVSSELSTLNETLENKVEERTRELSRSHAHIEGVVEHLPVGLIEIGIDGRIAQINQVASSLFGIDEKAAIGTLPSSHENMQSVFAHDLLPGNYDAQITSPRTREVEVTIAPLALEEGIGAIAIIHDVTDIRALERSKSDFIATAAHQLRTPLAALKWVFDLLLSDKTVPEQEHQVIERGASGLKNMEHITEELLMSVRTSEGVSSYAFAPSDMKKVINDAAAVLIPVAAQKKIALSIEIAPELPQMTIDPERMMFAIQNLIDNAIKYTPQGGSVRVAASATPQQFVATVADTGIGIAPGDREHIFEKFFRARQATEMFANGSGLGLFIVKSIIEAHHGTLTIESELGKGSTFTITLPSSIYSATN